MEPASATLPVRYQLMTNVSSVPSIRQLTAFRTDLVWVSFPRNRTTREPRCFVPYLVTLAGLWPPTSVAREITNGHRARTGASAISAFTRVFNALRHIRNDLIWPNYRGLPAVVIGVLAKKVVK